MGLITILLRLLTDTDFQKWAAMTWGGLLVMAPASLYFEQIDAFLSLTLKGVSILSLGAGMVFSVFKTREMICKPKQKRKPYE